jgi:translation initiation factor IF-2
LLQKEKVRVYILARELNMDTTDLLRLCKQAGFDVKNQLSSLDPDQQVKLEEMVKKGTKASAVAAPVKPPVIKPVTPEEKPVPQLKAPRVVKRVEVEAPSVVPTVAEAPIAEPEPTPVVEAPPMVESAPPKPVIPVIREKVPTLGTKSAGKAPAAKAEKPEPPTAPPAAKPEVKPEPAKTAPTPPVAPPTVTTPAPITHRPQQPKAPQDLNKTTARDGGSGTGRPASPSERRPDQPRRTISSPSQFGHLKPIAPPQLQKSPQAKPVDKGPKIAKPIAVFTRDQLDQAKPIKAEDLLRPQAPTVVEPDDEDDAGKKDKKRAIPGREQRQKDRNLRAEKRKEKKTEVAIVGGAVVFDEEDRISAHYKRVGKHRPHKQVIKQRPTHLELTSPITIRTLSEEMGVRSVELIFKIKELGATSTLNINSVIDDDVAVLVASAFNCALTVVAPLSEEEKYLENLDPPDDPDDLVLRAPIVTVMGHVDHGKTSLLDKIRRSNVVDTEAGGITQVIRAWRVEHGGRPVTFLDTPGHEAFTKMRARGAQVTDVAVIVVAADDGVMPQTEEAISHAKAAGVSLVIAINKIDMPSANINRTRQQLYGLDVLPDNMGGDTPFVETSAATGKGIDELLDQLAVVAELKELKANPKRHAKGTCLEANLSEEEGVHATLLVGNGTLHRGDIVLCGASYGRVRQMYNDLGKPIQEAGPSVPVRITGLDVVPDASDEFQVLDDLNMAADLAARRKQKLRETTVHKRQPLTLERLTETKIDELKVILKADFRGSVEAIRKELDKLQHAEVRVRVLEAGIGLITENDVWLALASPEDTMIVGFNVVPDDNALKLAEERGIKISEYNIIYNLTNDIRAALEGKLKPREEVVHLGRAIVRETFKISRVGTIAGCYVTTGNIKRNAKVRVIREGVVIYPPADRSAGLESLKRFKEDTGEVREGFECGIKVAGYDDIKVGDVIEAYRVDQVQRTLE